MNSSELWRRNKKNLEERVHFDFSSSFMSMILHYFCFHHDEEEAEEEMIGPSSVAEQQQQSDPKIFDLHCNYKAKQQST